MRWILFAVLLPGPAFAACPDLPDRSPELEALFDAARAAPTEQAGRELSDRMWAIWTDPPDEAAGALLARGMAARRVFDSVGAIDAFDRLVDYCPDWAEGYNQRAFVYFLSAEFEKARIDLAATLEINPSHVGALSGMALTLAALGDEVGAQDWLKKALALNPWIPERHMLKPPAGEEL